MKSSTVLACLGVALLSVPRFALSGVIPAVFDLSLIRDTNTLESKIIQDWQPVAKLKGVKQKLIEITVCEWWPGQKVRLPVTLCAPESDIPCTCVLIGNMGLSLKPALPGGAMLKLLTDHGVGVVLVGMSTIDAMEPKGRLHLGMKEHLLTSKDARFTPAWIWGMSDMRALTAAFAETAVFKPGRVLATGGSKRGVGAAICGIYDDRFTAILPVVTPIIGNPGGAYVRGSALIEEEAMNAGFLKQLPPGPNPLGLPDTAREALEEREQRRMDQAITKEEAITAGWSEAEMLQMNDEAWNACRMTAHLKTVRQRGLEFFYHVGTNDNVCPGQLQLGQEYSDFPIYILPGGQHGGPKTGGFTLQTPTQPEAEENLLAFARHHFFGDRSLPKAPKIKFSFEPASSRLKVIVSFEQGVMPHRSTLSWCENRQPPYTYAAEYDRWKSSPMTTGSDGTLSAEIDVPVAARTIDFVSTHMHEENGLPFHFSSPYQRWVRP